MILGTLAIENPELINRMDERYYKKIIVGADVRDGKIASHGWKNQSDIMAVDLIKTFESSVVNSVIYTRVFLKMEAYKELALLKLLILLSQFNSVIASGGVSSLNDISKLSEEFSNGNPWS